MSGNLVCILGIDNFLKKNVPQAKTVRHLGMRLEVFTNDSINVSSNFASFTAGLHSVKVGFLGRLWQIFRYFARNFRQMHHCEIYPAGRFGVFYCLMAKLFCVPIIVVERGDIGILRSYPLPLRLSLLASYKLADLIWYKEYYMEPLIKQVKREGLYFLPNGVPEASIEQTALERDIDFLWVNRVVPARKAHWFVDILSKHEFKDCRSALLGILPDSQDPQVQALQHYVLAHRPQNMEIKDYGDPASYYRRAKFFVLPSDVVFGNNALFESMMYGVIPLISDIAHTDKIVPDREHGFRFHHSFDGLLATMKEALLLPAEHRQKMAEYCRSYVMKHFGYEQWQEGLKNLYIEVLRGS